jgi:hypothetical protein
MATGFRITYDQAQFKRIEAKLNGFEKAQVLHQTQADVAKFLQVKMQDYPPQKRVTRMQAFGKTFFSAKQRRYFFWALHNGNIKVPYHRTDELRRGWRIITAGNATTLTNAVPYAPLVQERNRQSRMQTIIGWRTVSYYLQMYKSEIGRVGLTNIRRWKDS